MSSWLIRIIILACTAVHLLGCAERYRNADAGRTASEVEQFYLDNVAGKPGSSPQADAMIQDSSTNIYYAESYVDPGGTIAPMGPIEAVTPIHFDDPKLNLNLTAAQIQTIRVYFFDAIDPQSGRRNYALVMHIVKKGSSQPQIFAAVNTGSGNLEEASVDDDGIFEVAFQLAGAQLIVESDDTTEGELNDVVQLRLYIDDEQGYGSIGQISSMVGFLSK